MAATSGANYIETRGGNDSRLPPMAAMTASTLATGNDVVDGEQGNDTIDGSSGHDVIYGGAGDDSLNGGSDSDSVFGGAGDDQGVHGAQANGVDEFADGGEGTDTLQLWHNDGDLDLFFDMASGGIGDGLAGTSDRDQLRERDHRRGQ